MIPAALARNARQVWGPAGKRWRHAAVGAGRPHGSAAVLKVGLPGAAHLRVEAAALRAYDGRGAVRLLAHDPARGALLLERVDPGTPASALPRGRWCPAPAGAGVATGAQAFASTCPIDDDVSNTFTVTKQTAQAPTGAATVRVTIAHPGLRRGRAGVLAVLG